MRPSVWMILFATTITIVTACGTDDPGPVSFGDDVDDPEVPPRGSDDMRGWIDAGFYTTWSCEPEPHAPRAPSPHTRNRVCSNLALRTSTGDGPFPVGSAGVKEIFNSSGAISQFAVYRKMTDGEGGDTWYWYEARLDGTVFANGEGVSGCTGCHAGAERDFVFTIVP